MAVEGMDAPVNSIGGSD